MKIEYTEQFNKSFERLFSNNLRFLIPRTFGNWSSELKLAWQRVFRGYDDTVLWNLEAHVSMVSQAGIKYMLENGHSYPSPLNEKEWRVILKTILKGFESYDKITNLTYVTERKTITAQKNFYKKLNKEHEEGMKLYAKYFGHLWD